MDKKRDKLKSELDMQDDVVFKQIFISGYGVSGLLMEWQMVMSCTWKRKKTERLVNFLRRGQSFAIQADDIRGGKLILEGAGVINNLKLVGVMNDEDIAALNWLNGEVKGGIIEAVQQGKPLSVEVINRTRKKIKTEWSGDHLTINIEVSGKSASKVLREK